MSMPLLFEKLKLLSTVADFLSADNCMMKTFSPIDTENLEWEETTMLNVLLYMNPELRLHKVRVESSIDPFVMV